MRKNTKHAGFSQKPENSDVELLRMLYAARGKPVSGGGLSRRLNLSRAAVWKKIESLREAGYGIAAATNRGYRLVSAPDRVLAEEILMRLRTRWLGRSLQCLNRTDSTNRAAHDLATRNARTGAAVFAESQSRGRGRLGRAWASPVGGLYFSVLLRPRLEMNELPRMTLQAAEAVCEVLRRHYGIPARTKWPNDIWARGKKICGILTEASAEADRVFYVVMGIGVNANSLLKSLPPGATSIRRQIKRPVNRAELAARILDELESRVDAAESPSRRMRARWKKSSLLLGKKVRVKTLRGNFTGTALDIDPDGCLVVGHSVIGKKYVHSGDVLLCRN